MPSYILSHSHFLLAIDFAILLLVGFDDFVLLHILVFGLYQWFVCDLGGLVFFTNKLYIVLLLFFLIAIILLFCRFEDESFQRRKE